MIRIQNNFDFIVSKFPPLFSAAFTYGSGVFPQNAGCVSGKMVDVIFSVDDSLAFHKENMKINSSHYSALKYRGPEFIKKIQEGLGAKVYFNTLIKIENVPIKYGVISTSHLIEDLLDWKTLYVSGRLHKPVKFIKKPESQDLTRALITNLNSALHASLLNLPEKFSEKELFRVISRLSYDGDFRMYFGEDKNKIENIVQNQMLHFRKLYDEHLKKMSCLNWNQSQGAFEQDSSYKTTLYHLKNLPQNVQENILIKWNKDGKYQDKEEVLEQLALRSECSKVVKSSIQDIVFWSSITQSAKGILTAGLIKSMKYSSRKVRKMIESFHIG